MYMRQIMQLVVAFAMLMPSAVTASNMLVDGNVASEPVKETGAVASDVRTVVGTVYDAATNLPMAGVRVQATGHTKVTTMTNAEGKYKLNVLVCYNVELLYSRVSVGSASHRPEGCCQRASLF